MTTDDPVAALEDALPIDSPAGLAQSVLANLAASGYAVTRAGEDKNPLNDPLLCHDCGHHIHNPDPVPCRWHDCECGHPKEAPDAR